MILDLNAVFEAHQKSVLSDRDPADVHGSDLHGCDYALWNRTHGIAELPYDLKAFSTFERGYAYEGRMLLALESHLPQSYTVTSGHELMYKGVVGHPDYIVYRRGQSWDFFPDAIIDCYTTARKEIDWDYGHALKNAFYAVASDAEHFCEWVFQIGFGGAIVAQEPFWFETDEWRERVEEAIERKMDIASSDQKPETEPPVNPKTLQLEDWRCNKGYCRAVCPRNVRMKA